MTSITLYCFHHAGGSEWQFRKWPSHLHPSVKVVGVPLERDGGKSEKSVEQLASSALSYIAPSDIGSSVFYGHSMGGLIAFELCRMLIEARRELPAKVILGGSPAPGTLRLEADWAGPSTMDALPQYIRDRTAAGITRSRAYAPPQQRLPVPLELIRGRRDELVSTTAMLAWEEYCTETPRYHLIDGDHLFHRTSTDAFMSVLRDLIPCTATPVGNAAVS